MNLCMVSGSEFNGKFTSGHMDCIFDWVQMYGGVHRSITSLKGHLDELNQYDVVLIVDADRFLDDAYTITQLGTCKTVFIPEGTAERYMCIPFGNYEKVDRLFRSVDLIGAMEEDRVQWYESIWDTKTFFMHVPASEGLLNGSIRDKVEAKGKSNRILICCNLGFGTPYTQTNLQTSLGAAKRSGKPCLICEIPADHAKFAGAVSGIENIAFMGRQHYTFYREEILGPSMVLLNPSEIIGTSRNAIVGAGVGTPVIGNMHSHTQMRLFPDLATYVYDIDRIVDLIGRLYDEPAFYDDVCDQAFERIQHYSRANAARRFEEALCL